MPDAETPLEEFTAFSEFDHPPTVPSLGLLSIEPTMQTRRRSER
jgi:hypothetical protein